jgi:hypothetical protein
MDKQSIVVFAIMFFVAPVLNHVVFPRTRWWVRYLVVPVGLAAVVLGAMLLMKR